MFQSKLPRFLQLREKRLAGNFYLTDNLLTSTPLSNCDTASMIEAKVLTYGFAIRSRIMAVAVGGFRVL